MVVVDLEGPHRVSMFGIGHRETLLGGRIRVNRNGRKKSPRDGNKGRTGVVISRHGKGDDTREIRPYSWSMCIVSGSKGRVKCANQIL